MDVSDRELGDRLMDTTVSDVRVRIEDLVMADSKFWIHCWDEKMTMYRTDSLSLNFLKILKPFRV